MKGEWKLSNYTSLVKSDSGDLLLHNSFMGAVARIPANRSTITSSLLKQSLNVSDADREALEELYDGGFLVDSTLDERSYVDEILKHERDSLRFSLIILPHENCNFRCVYCYEDYTRGKMRKDVIAGLKALVNKKTSKYKELHVSWFGGEPLLASDVIFELSDSFIDSCDKDGISFSSSMTTNGYLLTEDVVDRLFKRNIRTFQVTLDGPAFIHNRNRKLAGQGGTYEKILNNLKAMSHRDEDFLVRIRVNFDNYSAEVIESWLRDELSQFFARDNRFALSFESIGKWGGVNDGNLDVCNPELASPLILKFIQTSLFLGFSDKTLKSYLMPQGNVCYAAKESSIVVGSDGKIYKCTVAFNDSRNVVGQLYPDGEIAFDNNRLRLWTQLDNMDTSWCDRCSFYPSCQGRKCPLSSMKQNIPSCPMDKTKYEALIKLAVYGRQPDIK